MSIRNIRIAKKLVRLARILVSAEPDKDSEKDYDKIHDQQMRDGKDFPGLAGFFMLCLIHQVRQKQQDAFVELLKKPGQTIKESDYERFTEMQSFPEICDYLKYLPLINFSTLKDFNDFIDDEYDRLGYANDTSTSPEALSLLAYDENDSVAKCAMENPNMTDAELSKLAKSNDVEIRKIVSKNPSTPEETLDILADDNELYVQLHVAGNPHTSDATLAKLSERKNRMVRSEVAENPSTPVEILVKLAKDPNNLVRSSVAYNKNAPIDILNQLSSTEVIDDYEDNHRYVLPNSIQVHFNVAKNPNTPVETLLKMLDFNYVNRKWFNDVARFIASNPSATPEIMMKIMEKTQDSSGPLIDMAYNENTQDNILEIIAKKPVEGIKTCVSMHPNASSGTLEWLAEHGDPETRVNVARHPNTNDETLELLASDDVDQVKITVINRKNTPRSILRMMQYDDSKYVRISLASNTRTPAGVLEYLAEDSDKEVRDAVYRNPNYNDVK